MRLTALPLLILCGCARALHSYEVGVTDWHKALAGVPLTQSAATAPVFHRRTLANGGSSSVVLTATESNVLAAVHSANGSLAWRHLFDDDDHILGFKRHDDVVATLSGPGGAHLRTFDPSTGHLLFENKLHAPDAGLLEQPEDLGTAVTFDSEGKDIYVLSNGHILRRFDRHAGTLTWGWTAPDQTSSVIYSKIFVTPETVYLLGLTKSFASYQLHVASLSTETGELIQSGDYPTNLPTGLSQVFVLSHHAVPDIPPRVVMLEDNTIKSFPLVPDLKTKLTPVKGSYKSIQDVGVAGHGQFIATAEDGTGCVLGLNKLSLNVIWQFSDSSTSPTRSGSLYAGGVDIDGNPYIARVFWLHTLKASRMLASSHVFASHLANGKGLVTGYTFPFQTGDHGIIKHIAVETANPEEFKVLSRLVLTTTTGAVQLWQQDQMQWSREEGLSDIRIAELVELPERKVAAQVDLEQDIFSTRLARQLLDAQDFPQYAVNFVRRFVTGSYASVSAPVAAPVNVSEPLSRDTFGFRKVIVAATGHGKVYGLDSANGAIMWSRVFGLGWAAKVGGKIIPAKSFIIRTASDGEGEAPQVAIVTQRKASNGLVDTVLFHIDALTGRDARADGTHEDLLNGHDIVSGPLVEVYSLKTESARVIVHLDEFLQVHLYPNTDEARLAFENVAESLRIPLRTGPPGQRQLTGHQVPPKDVRYLFSRPTDQPVASLGKVLGNRTTLYKYLNPNLVGVVTGPAAGAPRSDRTACALYLVDGAKGTVIYHTVLPAADGECTVQATLVENWLVYHYYDPEVGVNQAKTWRMVSVELYEGNGPDDKIKSSDLSSFSNETMSRSSFPRGIRTVASTSTTYGITIKDLIIANQNNQVQVLQRRFLDPRRPKQKPTAQEMEEWLIQYDPVLPDDPKRVLSHNYQVAKVRKIVTSPALLESTSLVFAYGLDLFFSRVAPSNTFDVLSESFNKTQLVVTIAGLALAIAIVKPIVTRKRLRERWYD
ncbi:uncharacterized protein BXZ73DRAFT_93328 [Epithele typhae]|uniref:uncharacterized protein n=1 Tax=Epithele typhae TaxID=378194 RepID=UPI0020073D43|nr:uncharacterized protein BXZ73DRAFT_93328 [Epithele typhae]KAH9911778.1 hypothetical protein BXZ73DRAFT_93328 [Epithele typhae]